MNSAEWQGGKPRAKDDVLLAPLPKEGTNFKSRDARGLFAGEIFEPTGALTSVMKNGGFAYSNPENQRHDFYC